MALIGLTVFGEMKTTKLPEDHEEVALDEGTFKLKVLQ